MDILFAVLPDEFFSIDRQTRMETDNLTVSDYFADFKEQSRNHSNVSIWTMNAEAEFRALFE